MKIRTAVAIFALAGFALVASLVLGLMREGEPIYIVPVYILLGIAGVLVIALVMMGIFFEGKERWTIFTLAAILLILFSALSIFSMGIFIVPVALLLLGFSIWKWKSRRNKAQV
jgi:ABC-type transport system involved in cytochrome c biogenesis permease subunit